MASSPPSAAYLAESRVWQVNVFYSIAIPMELITTVLRLWIKKTKRNGPGCWYYDDLLVLVATCLGVGQVVTGLCTGPSHGLGRHIQAVSKNDLSALALGIYIFTHLYNAANGMSKLSILAAYYRIFSTTRFRIVVLCTVAVIAAWVAATALLMVFGCSPVQAWWGGLPPGAPFRCIDRVALSYFTNSANLAANLWIFSMPIPVIVRLKTSVDKRVCMVMLFSVGLCTCAFSVVRLKATADTDSGDYTWDAVRSGIVSVWEPCCGILCANLPIISAPVMEACKRGKLRSRIRSGAHIIPWADPNTPDAGYRTRSQGPAGEAMPNRFMRGEREDVELLKVAVTGHNQC